MFFVLFHFYELWASVQLVAHKFETKNDLVTTYVTPCDGDPAQSFGIGGTTSAQSAVSFPNSSSVGIKTQFPWEKQSLWAQN